MRETNPQPHGERTRRWKRTAAAALLLLAGGAVVNVAVAWGFILWPQAPRTWTVFFTADENPSWHVSRASGITFDRLVLSRSVFRNAPGIPLDVLLGNPPPPEPPTAMPPSWSRVNVKERPDTTASVFAVYVEEARGWPMRSMYSLTRDESDSWMSTPAGLLSSSGLLLDVPSLGDGNLQNIGAGNLQEKGVIPLQPLWPGFIINTLFYALLLWLLLFTPFAARRMLRRRRGLCETCAYPIGGSPVCTECGAAVARNEPRARQDEPRA